MQVVKWQRSSLLSLRHKEATPPTEALVRDTSVSTMSLLIVQGMELKSQLLGIRHGHVLTTTTAATTTWSSLRTETARSRTTATSFVVTSQASGERWPAGPSWLSCGVISQTTEERSSSQPHASIAGLLVQPDQPTPPPDAAEKNSRCIDSH